MANKIEIARRCHVKIGELDTKDFSNQAIRSEYCLLALLEGKLALAGAHEQSELSLALPLLWQAADVMTASYPLAKTFKEAKKRSEYWQGIFPGEPAQFLALGLVAQLLETTANVWHADEALFLGQLLNNWLVTYERNFIKIK